MPRVLRLTVFQYLPFFSYALPLAPIGALGIGVLPKSHPTIIYRQIAFGAAIACPRSRLAGHVGHWDWCLLFMKGLLGTVDAEKVGMLRWCEFIPCSI